MKYQKPYGSLDPDAPYVDYSAGVNSGSKIPAGFPNWTQREIVDVIAKSGFTPDDVLQLASAIQSQKMNFAVAGGAANALTAVLSPTPTLFTGLAIRLMLTNTNTAAATLNLNGLGNKPIVKFDGGALARGELIAGTIAEFAFDATGDRWIIVSAIRYGFGAGQQYFNTAGAMSFTVPVGVTIIEVECWGGGAGGGGIGAGGNGSAGGGGGGGYARKRINVTPGQVLTGTVGANGAGGGAGGSGSAGGTTSFGGVVTCNGGTGGGPNPTGNGGGGGAATGGDINATGGAGTAGAAGASVSGGPGGTSSFGGAGGGGGFGIAGPGASPGGGGGGSGSAGANSGGSGAVGAIFIKW
ncbi:hypothetical protein [Rhizobium metallidurans]|uniref:Glycine-rich domain-containing protein n=1 Tax=Rhizobium metallidurans TaxID=1265931 RepID=A0A7W6D0G1_9HYPH|nr:hypothetical protein [Rhizobium metallidurans]MBB3965961.1 hypothetical protein [Rhizobium metallidurans]